MMDLDDALTCADNMRTTIDAEGFACAEDFALVCLAAEVRRLRDDVNGLTGTADRLEKENAALRTDAAAMNKSLEMMREENKRLKDLMAKRSREHQQEMTSYRLRVKSQDDATFSALREENDRLKSNPPQSLSPMPPDCRTCANRGHINGLSQETYCDSCMWYGAYWKKNHYSPMQEPTP